MPIACPPLAQGRKAGGEGASRTAQALSDQRRRRRDERPAGERTPTRRVSRLRNPDAIGGRTMTNTDTADIREAVREHYANAATQAASGAFEEARRSEAETACCGTGCPPAAAVSEASFGAALYGAQTSGEIPQAAVEASLGCGVPTAVADLHHGEREAALRSVAGASGPLSPRPARATRHALVLG